MKLDKAILAFLAARGTATASLPEIARGISKDGGRGLVQSVRVAAVDLQERGLVDVYERGRPVRLGDASASCRLRAAAVKQIDYRANPAQYVIGRGEQGVLTVEPYKSELLPLWTFKTPALARASSRKLYAAFLAYGRAGDFVGMDMARKFLQMGWTRARRYANHKTGRKYLAGEVAASDPDPAKAEAAEIFHAVYVKAMKNRTYATLRRRFVAP